MEFDPKSNDVLQLLRKLKDSNATYPQELLVVRRQGYLRQVAEVAGGAGLAIGLRNTVKHARGASGFPPAAGTLLEGLLVVAIVAEASTLTYFYRSQLAEYVQKLTNQPRVEEVTDPPVFASPIPGLQLTPSPLADEAITATETLETTTTPDLTVTLQQESQPTGPSTGQETGSGGGHPASTPVPNGGGDSNGSNGNHYGQTPKPDRTKEKKPGDSISSDDGGSQDTESNPKKTK